MDKKKQTGAVVAVGAGIGVGVGGLFWYYVRSQERAELVTRLAKSQKIKLMQNLSPVLPVPKKLETIAQGLFDQEAEKMILLTNMMTAEEALAEIEQDVQGYIDSIPEEGLDRLKELVGIDDALLGKIKQVVNFFKGGQLKFGGGKSSGGGEGTSKERPS